MLIRVCSWCRATMGTVECPETGITNGICPKCREKLLEEMLKQPLTEDVAPA